MGLPKKDIARLLRIKGAKIQTDRLKARKIKLPNKPREKSEPTEKQSQKNEDERIIGELPIGRTVITRDNENVKPGGKE